MKYMISHLPVQWTHLCWLSWWHCGQCRGWWDCPIRWRSPRPDGSAGCCSGSDDQGWSCLMGIIVTKWSIIHTISVALNKRCTIKQYFRKIQKSIRNRIWIVRHDQISTKSALKISRLQISHSPGFQSCCLKGRDSAGIAGEPGPRAGSQKSRSSPSSDESNPWKMNVMDLYFSHFSCLCIPQYRYIVFFPWFSFHSIMFRVVPDIH